MYVSCEARRGRADGHPPPPRPAERPAPTPRREAPSTARANAAPRSRAPRRRRWVKRRVAARGPSGTRGGMARIDTAQRTLTLKLVYYGPAMGGKTTNLQSLHAIVDPTKSIELRSLDTEG